MHGGEIREDRLNRLPQCRVQCVDGAVTFTDDVNDVAIDPQLDRCFGHCGRIVGRFDVHSEMDAVELRFVCAGDLLDQQVERRFRRFELVALSLEVLHSFKDAFHQFGIVGDFVLRRLGHDVRPAGQFADQNSTFVANEFRFDVLVAFRDAINRMDVHAALVSERAATDVRLVVAKVHVRQLVDIARQFREVGNRSVNQAVVTFFLEHQVGDNAQQAGIAAAFSDAVDRALHLDGSLIEGSQ